MFPSVFLSEREKGIPYDRDGGRSVFLLTLKFYFKFLVFDESTEFTFLDDCAYYNC